MLWTFFLVVIGWIFFRSDTIWQALDYIRRIFRFNSSFFDFSTFVGRIGVGRISQGTIKPMMDVVVMEGPDGKAIKGRINQVLTFQGLERVQATEAGPGEIVLINGLADIGIGDRKSVV